MNERYYKVIILANTPDIVEAENPDFRFEEKEKLMSFIDICLENGHEIIIVKTPKNE